MTPDTVYALVGAGLFGLGLHALIGKAHLFHKILALNIMGSGTFLMLVAAGRRGDVFADAVSQAMVITGIVVAVSATALALTLMLKLAEATGRTELPED